MPTAAKKTWGELIGSQSKKWTSYRIGKPWAKYLLQFCANSFCVEGPLFYWVVENYIKRPTYLHMELIWKHFGASDQSPWFVNVSYNCRMKWKRQIELYRRSRNTRKTEFKKLLVKARSQKSALPHYTEIPPPKGLHNRARAEVWKMIGMDKGPISAFRKSTPPVITKANAKKHYTNALKVLKDFGIRL